MENGVRTAFFPQNQIYVTIFINSERYVKTPTQWIFFLPPSFNFIYKNLLSVATSHIKWPLLTSCFGISTFIQFSTYSDSAWSIVIARYVLFIWQNMRYNGGRYPYWGWYVCHLVIHKRGVVCLKTQKAAVEKVSKKAELWSVILKYACCVISIIHFRHVDLALARASRFA